MYLELNLEVMSNDSGEWLRNKIEKQLRKEWEEYIDIHANSKGSTYEESFADLIRSYFGGVYDVNTRVAVIDPELDCFNFFDFQSGEEELDIVATFSNSTPRIVFETGQGSGTLKWVPYTSVAAICEVKSQLNKQALERDLGKLKKLDLIDESIEDRFGMRQTTGYSVEHPVKCLIYNESSIADDTLEELLNESLEYWDIVLIVNNGTLILNSKLPFSNLFMPLEEALSEIPIEDVEVLPEILEQLDGFDPEDFELDPDVVSVDNGLMWFLITISATIPDPLSVNAGNTFAALAGNRTFKTHAATDFSQEE
jgi:hypothetical protein